MRYQVLIKWRVSLTNMVIKFRFNIIGLWTSLNNNQAVSGIICHAGNKHHVGDLTVEGKII
jgi:hypothetical protein